MNYFKDQSILKNVVLAMLIFQDELFAFNREMLVHPESLAINVRHIKLTSVT